MINKKQWDGFLPSPCLIYDCVVKFKMKFIKRPKVRYADEQIDIKKIVDDRVCCRHHADDRHLFRGA